MTEEKSKKELDSVKDKKNKVEVKKASTGAWWKSVTSLLNKEEETKKNRETAPEKVEKPKKEKTKEVASESKTVGDSNNGKSSKKEEVKVARGKKNDSEGEKSLPARSGKSSGSKKEKAGAKKKKSARKTTVKSKSELTSAKEEKVQKKGIEEVAQARGNLKLLINAEETEECRIALIEDGKLDSFHVTTVVRERTKNNIYKGVVVAVESNLQAAFVDIGTAKNGFLPFSEIHPEYYREDISDEDLELVKNQKWKKLKIENVISKGQEVLVQVVKEVTGNKGANMTTYLSLPGRCLVLLPGSDSAGISRKIVGEERRSELRDIMSKLKIPEGVGYIIRTASAEITKTALQKDLRFLLSLWRDIKKKGQTLPAPALVYEDQETVLRFLRDHFTADIKEIQVDTQESLDQVKQFLELLPAKQRKVKLKMHRGAKPIFNQYNIEEQIESIYKPQVPLPSGGSIVIDPTEALVAIDVNSGRTSKNGNFEETIYQANMEAAEELARQLRLRDLGGLIVVDFIDMRNKKHIKDVEKQVKACMKRDKAKVDISRISRFGLMQISRQKMGAPIEKGSYLRCDHCKGRGVIKSVESQVLYTLRRIQTGVTRKKVERLECRLPEDVAYYLLNKKRKELNELEAKHNSVIDIVPSSEMKPSDCQLNFINKS